MSTRYPGGVVDWLKKELGTEQTSDVVRKALDRLVADVLSKQLLTDSLKPWRDE